jgi:hypothetical protein
VCALEKKATNEVIVLAAVITSFAVGWTVAQSCESQAVSRKASRFMVLPSFVRKCKQDAHESQAASKEAPHAAKAIHGKVSEVSLGFNVLSTTAVRRWFDPRRRERQHKFPGGLSDARLHTPPPVQVGWPGNSSALQYLRIAVSSNVQWRREPCAI